MEKEQPKKCFCARCFLPIDEEDKVDIGGQNFHRICSMCCVCRTIPSSIKMFYGHVFCNECFKMHVLGRFKGETPRMHSSSWWTQWAPGAKPQDANEKDASKTSENTSEEPAKKYICSRCLQTVDENNKVDIDGQHFHPQCAKCYFCQTVPTSNLKIYYGQVFCEECFHRHVLNRNRDNPSEFFKTCFEQWQNVQFAEGMRQFMGSNNSSSNKEGGSAPFIYCHCAGQSEWGAQPDTRKSATPGNASIPEDEESLEDLYFENRTEMSDIPESCHAIEIAEVPAAEKIEKLTKYLHEVPSQVKAGKKWKNFVVADKISLTSCGWVDLQDSKVDASFDCPKCLWQCGPIFVQSELLQRSVRSKHVFQ